MGRWMPSLGGGAARGRSPFPAPRTLRALGFLAHPLARSWPCALGGGLPHGIPPPARDGLPGAGLVDFLGLSSRPLALGLGLGPERVPRLSFLLRWPARERGHPRQVEVGEGKWGGGVAVLRRGPFLLTWMP